MSRSSLHHTVARRRPRALVALGLALALATSACASSVERGRTRLAAAGALDEVDPNDFIRQVVTDAGGSAAGEQRGPEGEGGGGPGVGGPVGGGGPGVVSGPTATTVPATGGPRARADQPTAGSGPGISDTKIKVGFIVPGTEETEGSFGFSLPPDGDVRAQINTLAKYINDRGGVFGRSIEPVLFFHNIQEASQRKENEICTKFTEDDKVFAIVLNAQIHEATRFCYAQHNTLMLETSLFGFDDDFYAQLSPYYWSPSMPTMSRVLRTLVDHIETVGYWEPDGPTEPARLGVIMWDLPSYVRVYETDVVPRLQSHGRTVTSSQRVNPQDAGTIQNGLSAAAAKFKAAGVNRVIFVGTAPLAPFFTLTAKGQDFEPRYAMTTFDNPIFYESYEPAQGQIEDMVGIGFSMSADVGDAQYQFPHPDNPLEQLCMRIVDDAGHNRPARKNGQLALYSCEAMFLLKKAADKVSGPLTPATWAGAGETIRGDWQAASGFAHFLGPGQHAAGTAYRAMAWDTSCDCITYTSPVRTLADD